MTQLNYTNPVSGAGVVPMDSTTGTKGEVQSAQIALPDGVNTNPVSASNPLPVKTADGGQITVGTTTDGAWSGTGGGSLVALLKAVWTRIGALIAQLPAALGAGGGLKVDGSGTALPISGTVTANAGTGTQAVSLAVLPALAAGTNGIGSVGTIGSASLPSCGVLAATVTAAALAASTACSEVLVQADPANTTNALLGNATAQAIVLQAGQSVTIPAANINLIFAKMASGTGNINFLARS